MVAGAEQNTSIAFGYAIESYIDFGIPMMFAPVLAFGVGIGCLYVLFRRSMNHRELFVAFGTVAFWMSVYLFERAWATMLGITIAMMVYLGVPVLMLDQFLLGRSERMDRAQQPTLYQTEPSQLR
jgi:hypothetical protein